MENKILIFPTDTVYGIGCKFDDIDLKNKILEIKKRPLNKHFSVLCKDMEQCLKLGYFNEFSLKVANKFWPGAITIIVKTNELYKDQFGDTIGLRIPNNELSLKLIDEIGPLATTSVNISGFPPLNDYDEIMKEFGKCDVLIFKDDSILSKKSSTVVDLTEGINIIRLGDITLDDLKNV